MIQAASVHMEEDNAAVLLTIHPPPCVRLPPWPPSFFTSLRPAATPLCHTPSLSVAIRQAPHRWHLVIMYSLLPPDR